MRAYMKWLVVAADSASKRLAIVFGTVAVGCIFVGTVVMAFDTGDFAQFARYAAESVTPGTFNYRNVWLSTGVALLLLTSLAWAWDVTLGRLIRWIQEGSS